MSVPKGVFTDDWHEHDPRWTSVDAYTLSHLHPSTRPNHKALNAALEHAMNEGLPDIATYPILGKMLALQCRVGKVEHALEVGTLGAYSPIWMTTENPGLRVTTIEIDEKHAKVAEENVVRAGVADRVEIIVGNAMDVLPKLIKDIEAGTRPRIGLTYIDADKLNNLNYFNFAVEMSAPGAVIYVDNIVRRGKLVSDAHQNETGVVGARKLVEAVGKDDRVEALVQQTVAEKSYDGYLFAVVK